MDTTCLFQFVSKENSASLATFEQECFALRKVCHGGL